MQNRAVSLSLISVKYVCESADFLFVKYFVGKKTNAVLFPWTKYIGQIWVNYGIKYGRSVVIKVEMRNCLGT